MAQEKWLIEPGDMKTIDLELVRSLKVSLIGGQVDVIAHDEPTARVTVHSVAGRELLVALNGDTLEVDHPQLRWDNFIEVFRSWRDKARADVTVLVPRETPVRLGVVSASALVSGVHGTARLNTVSGDITADELVGDLDLNLVSGEASLRSHRGLVTAHTVSGDIMVSGEVTRFSADSVSGNVLLDLAGTPDRISTNSVSGDVMMRLDEGTAARYRVNTVSGTLHLDDLVVRGSLGRNFTHQSGALDGSWVDISTSSVSGNVTVVRRTEGSTHGADKSAPGASA